MYKHRNKASSSAAGGTVATATTAREDGSGDDVNTADGSAEEEEKHARLHLPIIDTVSAYLLHDLCSCSVRANAFSFSL